MNTLTARRRAPTAVTFAVLVGACVQPVAAATFVVTSAADSGPGTLRAAIDSANASPGFDTITFNVGGGGVRNIALASPLPAITQTVHVNALSQPGGDGVTPLIQIDGTGATNGSGLVVSGSNVTIQGLAIFDFPFTGVVLQGNDNVVSNCYVGLNLAGTAAPNGHNGVFVQGLRNVVQNSTVSGNTGDGVRIDLTTSDGNVIQANRIGTNPAGTESRANGGNGVVLSGAKNTRVGGDGGNGNVISANARNGVAMSAGATGNTLVRNHIGVAANGTSPLGNLLAGVLIVAPGNFVGGAGAGQFNVISANGGAGVELRGNDNVVRRGLIGTDLFGTLDLGNGSHGVLVLASNSLVGSGAFGDGGNLISGNAGDGVHVGNGSAVYTATRILGNRVGTDVNGAASLPNASGIHVADLVNTTTIGDTLLGNVISGNSGRGIFMNGDIGVNDTTIRANRIGTNAAGTGALGNGGEGIVGLYVNRTRIGDSGSGQNVVAANAGTGVSISGVSTSTVIEGNLIGLGASGGNLGNGGDGVSVGTEGVDINGNRIHANGGLGIDLGADGPLPNDEGDGDTGPNGSQNHPIITTADEQDGTTVVRYAVSGKPNQVYRLDLFVSPSCDASGYGEGAQLVNTFQHPANASGVLSVATDVFGQPPGTVFTATATEVGARVETSEFSPCFTSSTVPARIRFTAPDSSYDERAGTVSIAIGRALNTSIAASVRVDSSDVSGSATAGVDYQPVSTIVNFAPGQTSATVSLTLLDDRQFEPNESLSLTLSQPSAGAELATWESHTVTIGSDDAQPTLTLEPCSVDEGTGAGATTCTVVARLSNPSRLQVAFRSSATTGVGGASESSDFTPHAIVERVIDPGAETTTIDVPIVRDALDEDTESFDVTIFNVANATASSTQTTGTIRDDDNAPTIYVENGGCSLREPDAGFMHCPFVVKLTNPTARPVAFDLALASGTATSGNDFGGTSSRFEFPPGSDTVTVNVPVIADSIFEFDETYAFNVSNVANATPSALAATGTIQNDDPPPDFTMSPCVVVEGNADSNPCFIDLTFAAAQRPIPLVHFTDGAVNAIGPAEDASFEGPKLGGAVSLGINQSFGGWLVESGTIDVKLYSAMQTAHSRQLMDLNGDRPGAIGRDVTTVQGQGYVLSFALAGHPVCATKLQTLDVYFGDQLAGAFTFDVTNTTVNSMGWRYEARLVYASAATSRLRFVSTTPGNCGPHIDDVAVTPAGGASSGLDFLPTWSVDEAPLSIPAGATTLRIETRVHGDTVYEGDEGFQVRACFLGGTCHAAPALIDEDDPVPGDTLFTSSFE